jgi:flagellar basal-body rod protein FlgG
MRALSIAASGMQAQQLNVDVISHNIANMNTTSYKRQRAEFQDMLYQNYERPGSTSSASGAILPLGIQIGVGVRADAVGRMTEQGAVAASGNPYDLAIDGRGYFQITLLTGRQFCCQCRRPAGDGGWIRRRAVDHSAAGSDRDPDHARRHR